MKIRREVSMNRRSFLKGVTAGAAGVALSSALASSIAAGDKKKSSPNIIFIMADDLGYHDLGCYGQEKIQTPNVDRIAAEGIRFTQCYTGSTICAPSRNVLMTGQHTGHTRIRGNTGQDRRSYGTGRRSSAEACPS